MNAVIRIPLQTTQEQALRLHYLQQGFAQLCNALAPLVQSTRIWSRVALHHLAYRQLREQFPSMGSQMVCNAIYSVSRTCRMVFQHPCSPFHLNKLGEGQLPLLRFSDTCPVYFDRHTLSLKEGVLSMFTLDGRMRFQLSLDSEVERRLQTQKLREVVLSREADGVFVLSFVLIDSVAVAAIEGSMELPEPGGLPDYVMVDEVV
ncbi:hypothetical protein [Comamonas aquatica]|uniref:hypothetical protein n=1 Tax=Comamonas aquatica TaxID=225991 RepID=UPI0009F3C3D7|nr:hypothetical protein [Comamonas aquatica]